MDFERFKQEYVAARQELESGELADAADVQAQLHVLAAQLTSGVDRQIAEGLIEKLGTVAAPRGQSPEMTQALQILDAADFTSGTKNERLAALAAARQQIWAIADRAGQDSTAIRGLTRGLESSENLLTDGMPWDDPSATGA
jgi:hypothetical protein